uniref:Uncharacterized protein n=1 Tax=Tanacetum cinerariifolium TaxID=118510 RepID=A0A6L2N9E4_TANCI|nr:hypothetical protein [Tanacetum cinerariifolium]
MVVFISQKNGKERFLSRGWHLEEINVTWAYLEKKRMRLQTCIKIHQEILFSERGDDVTGIKRHLRDLSSDGVWILATASQRSRLKVDLEPSTWRRRQKHQVTSSRRYAYIYKTDFRVLEYITSADPQGMVGLVSQLVSIVDSVAPSAKAIIEREKESQAQLDLAMEVPAPA